MSYDMHRKYIQRLISAEQHLNARRELSDVFFAYFARARVLDARIISSYTPSVFLLDSLSEPQSLRVN